MSARPDDAPDVAPMRFVEPRSLAMWLQNIQTGSSGEIRIAMVAASAVLILPKRAHVEPDPENWRLDKPSPSLGLGRSKAEVAACETEPNRERSHSNSLAAWASEGWVV